MHHVAKNMQFNKEVVTISLDFVLISCLLITPQVLSLNVLNLQCNLKNYATELLMQYILIKRVECVVM